MFPRFPSGPIKVSPFLPIVRAWLCGVLSAWKHSMADSLTWQMVCPSVVGSGVLAVAEGGKEEHHSR